MLAGRSSWNVLRTTRRFCAAGSRFEWQTLPSGLRIKHVRLAALGGLGGPPEGRCPCSTQVSDGNQGDGPVGDNQTIRVTYSTRLEDNTEIISNRVASFKVGASSQVLPAHAAAALLLPHEQLPVACFAQICQALDEGVRGMRVGDRRCAPAPCAAAPCPAAVCTCRAAPAR